MQWLPEQKEQEQNKQTNKQIKTTTFIIWHSIPTSQDSLALHPTSNILLLKSRFIFMSASRKILDRSEIVAIKLLLVFVYARPEHWYSYFSLYSYLSPRLERIDARSNCYWCYPRKTLVFML